MNWFRPMQLGMVVGIGKHAGARAVLPCLEAGWRQTLAELVSALQAHYHSASTSMRALWQSISQPFQAASQRHIPFGFIPDSKVVAR